ncbi:helix-turn-helix transcriptional regulator [Streptomyces sp. NPDC055058]
MASDYTFGWARDYDADQLAAFIEDLWGAAAGDNDLATLDAIEKAIADHRPPAAPPPKDSPLSIRQTEVLTEIANGATYRQAGTALGISKNSVATILRYATDRLGASNAAHAASVAAANGWLPGLRVPTPNWTLIQRKGARPGASFHRAWADRLRSRPGLTYSVGQYNSRAAASTTASQIRTARNPAYQPAGAFHASHLRGHDGFWTVRVRYAPETDTTQGTGS